MATKLFSNWRKQLLFLIHNDYRHQPLSANPNKMVKYNQTISLQKPTNCLSVFDHCMGLTLKGLKVIPVALYVYLSPLSACAILV